MGEPQRLEHRDRVELTGCRGSMRGARERGSIYDARIEPAPTALLIVDVPRGIAG